MLLPLWCLARRFQERFGHRNSCRIIAKYVVELRVVLEVLAAARMEENLDTYCSELVSMESKSRFILTIWIRFADQDKIVGTLRQIKDIKDDFFKAWSEGELW
jgi:hypothetical protein